MSLFDSLSKISEQIKQHRELMDKSEATVEQVSVLPFIDALGYDTQNPAEVRKQYAILNWDAVDYAILRNNEPIMVVEAKKASEALTKHWKQLFQYFNADKARVGILTNGIEYRFYTDLDKSNIMDKQPFLTLDMLNPDEQVVKELEGFTKIGFDSERITAVAQKRRITRLLKQEMSQPSDEFVRHFAKQVHSGRLTGADVQRYGQLVKDAWREIQSHETVIVKPPSENGEDDGQKPPPPPPGKDIPVFGYYEGHRFEAELLRKSINRGLTIAGNQIRYNGKTMWLKRAAVMAIQSVEPSFEPTRTYPNGFQFWHVVDPADGKEHMIRYISGWDMTDEQLRQRVLSS